MSLTLNVFESTETSRVKPNERVELFTRWLNLATHYLWNLYIHLYLIILYINTFIFYVFLHLQIFIYFWYIYIFNLINLYYLVSIHFSDRLFSQSEWFSVFFLGVEPQLSNWGSMPVAFTSSVSWRVELFVVKEMGRWWSFRVFVVGLYYPLVYRVHYSPLYEPLVFATRIPVLYKHLSSNVNPALVM